jgi:lysozyme family protein
MEEKERLWKFILSWESVKFVNDPRDRGGATKMGITLNTWKAYGYDKNKDGKINAEDIKLLSENDAKKIFYEKFWNRYKADKINDANIANLLVDWLWNGGIYAITKVQSFFGLKSDGIVGEMTIAAINKGEGHATFNKLWKLRADYYKSLNNPTFYNGWMNRLNSIQYGKLICRDKKTIIKIE